MMGYQRLDIKWQSYCMMMYAACVLAICDHVLDINSQDCAIKGNYATFVGQKWEMLLKSATLAHLKVGKFSNITNL